MSRELQPCGTPAAYKRHRKAGESACKKCRKAHRDYIASIERKSRATAARRLPLEAPENAHLAPCFANPGLWDPQGEGEPAAEVRARWEVAARICRTECPVFTHCEESRGPAAGAGVWAGRIPVRVS